MNIFGKTEVFILNNLKIFTKQKGSSFIIGFSEKLLTFRGDKIIVKNA